MADRDKGGGRSPIDSHPLDIGTEAALLDLAADDRALDLRGAFPDAVDADVALDVGPRDVARRGGRLSVLCVGSVCTYLHARPNDSHARFLAI